MGLLAGVAVAMAVVVVGPDSSGSTVRERTVTVSSGVIQTTVSGSGSLAPAKQLDLDFGSSGVVTGIYVNVGEVVGAGTVLARIDSTTADAQVAAARAQLASAEAQLENLRSGTSTSATGSAGETSGEAAASSATTQGHVATTPNATAGGTPTETTPTQTTPAATTPTETTPTQTTPGQTTPAQTSTPAQAAPAQSQTQTQGSQSSAPSQASVDSAQASVDSAYLSLVSAENTRARTVLRATVPGTVAQISGSEGDMAGGSSSSSSSSAGAGATGEGTAGNTAADTSSGFITLADLDRMQLDVSLSEADIGKVKLGQPATVTINAVSGQKVAAKVTAVSVLPDSSSSSTSSAVSYPVTLTLLQSARGVKAGMSASADIVTSQVSGLSVPSQAITGGAVTLLRGGERITQQVQAGVEGDTSTQVVSGLKAGDRVVVRSSAAAVAGGVGSPAGGAAGRRAAGGLGGGGVGGGGGGFPGGGGGPPGGGP